MLSGSVNPRLVAISGPPAGSVYPLQEKETSIGREATNSISFNDSSMSRRHCTIVKEPGGDFVINDLGSLNGTVVNRVPVKKRSLNHADQIQIGGIRFLFLLESDDQFPATVMDLDDSAVGGATVHLRREDSVYLRPESPLASSIRASRDLKILLEIAIQLQQIPSSARLRQRLLELLRQAIPAQHACLLNVNEDPLKITQANWLNRDSSPTPFTVSRTVLAQSLEADRALLCADSQVDQLFRRAASLQGVRSILCIPLARFNQDRLVLYLDSNDASATFGEDDLQLATAACCIAASALRNLVYTEWLESENSRLNREQELEHDMVGESASMQEVYRFIAKVARTDSTVLISGESGTGKELVARAIHRNSGRSRKPFVAINCAALTESLLESELFGHEKGAFTGAIAQKKGKLEVADTGTVFLDEIGELAPNLQTKLLRVLQERQLERVGGTRPIDLDIRVIAATNKDLKEAIAQGKFRSDLYYRINVVSIGLPALRDRRDDIELLANYFATVYSEKLKKPIRGISPEARACLVQYDWPGNVRELQNAMERALVMSASEFILPEDLPDSLLEQDAGEQQQRAGGGATAGYHQALKESKKQLILNAFEQAGRSYTEAARLLGLHPNYLHRLIRNLNMKRVLEPDRQAGGGGEAD